MNQSEFATLGGGCFWCVEAVYQRVDGVLSVKPGYAGGHIKNPTYNTICMKMFMMISAWFGYI